MKVAVTGAGSLIGAGVARRLTERGDDVTVLQRRASGLDVREIRADLTEADALARLVAHADAVVHVAARVSITGEWPEFERVNVVGTRLLLAAARDAGVSRFVYVSTPSVAHAGHSLVGEGAGPADPARARGHYARSKAIAECEVLEAAAPGFSVVAIRPHLVWGPGDQQLIGRIVDRARSRRLALVGTGSALIDTTYIDNAVDALVAAVDRCEAVSGRAYVVSNGEPRAVVELLDRIAAAAGLPGPRRRIPLPIARAAGSLAERLWRDRDDEPPMTSFLAEQLATAHWFDQRQTRRDLQWAPRVSIDEGLHRLSEWYAGAR